MTTAELSPEMQLAFEPVWHPDVPIEVIGLTGDFASGKTLFALSIAPGNHHEGHPYAGNPRTLYYDFEKSGGTYKAFGAKRVDFPDFMTSLTKADKRTPIYPNGYKPLDVFNQWYASINRLTPGQYDVIVADPASDIESGMTDWVKSRYTEFGFSSANAFEKTNGIFWSHVKNEWKLILTRIAALCQTFVFTTHLRSQMINGVPSKTLKEPKGKETLMELASLYLWLERKADADGKVPAKPAAKVLKTRLAATHINDDGDIETVPYLPPRLPIATPKEIRNYLEKPPNYSNLKKGERVEDSPVTRQEELLLEAEVEQMKLQREQTAMERLNRQAELQAMARRTVPSSDMSGQIKEQREVAAATSEATAPSEAAATAQESAAAEPTAEKAPLDPTGSITRDGKASQEVVSQIVELKEKLGMTIAQFKSGIKRATKDVSDNPLDLTPAQAEQLLANFKAIAQKRGLL